MGTLRETPLHERHRALGAKTGAFAGWDMPLVYTSVREEHRAVRAGCGVFDVSHMGQISVQGVGARAYLQHTLTNDVERLAPGLGQYTLVCRPDGGVIDDLIVYQLADEDYLIVCNASNVEPVFGWVAGNATADADVTDRSDAFAMLAVQGRGWRRALTPLAGSAASGDIADLAYFGVVAVELGGAGCLVARTGYTGEPGVEIMCPSGAAAGIWDLLMAGEDAPVPAGLAARDTLRLEMGYPLYGQELSLDRTPIEAGLRWACHMDGEFVGADVMRRQVADGTDERLCSFVLTEPGIPRGGCAVLQDDQAVGNVTSGTLSPTLDVGIGMAYLRAGLASPGTSIDIDVRGKRKRAEVRKRPLVTATPETE